MFVILVFISDSVLIPFDSLSLFYLISFYYILTFFFCQTDFSFNLPLPPEHFHIDILKTNKFIYKFLKLIICQGRFYK